MTGNLKAGDTVVAELPNGSAILLSGDVVAILRRHVPPTDADIEAAKKYIQDHPKSAVRIVGLAEGR